ncbi:hypothetical protein MMC21_000416 [Puttea exsequens]|nr:hypothetical protein [Puttea exsequens]
MDKRTSVTIEPARSIRDFEDCKSLFTAYAEALGLDLTFQDFETELHSLPGKYSPPTGEILLARSNNGIAMGCVALRPLAMNLCEMKRLYIVPDGRGLGLGSQLITKVLDTAVRLGYLEMKLDTLPSMVQAIALYKRAGFVATAPYYETPVKGTVFLACPLQRVDI